MLRFVPAEDRMFFDELSFRKIPIRENRRRVKRLDEFGKLLSKFIDLVSNPHESVDGPVGKSLCQSIDRTMPAASNMIHLAGISSIVSPG